MKRSIHARKKGKKDIKKMISPNVNQTWMFQIPVGLVFLNSEVG